MLDLCARNQPTAPHAHREHKDGRNKKQFCDGVPFDMVPQHVASRKRPATTPADDGAASATTPATASRPRPVDRVTIDVGGQLFVTSISTLTGASAYFSHAFSDRWQADGQEMLFPLKAVGSHWKKRASVRIAILRCVALPLPLCLLVP